SDALHVTVKFLGEVSDVHLDDVRAAVERAAAAARTFQMHLHGIGGFPNLRRPRVVWLGVEENVGLHATQEHAEEQLTNLGYEREARPYHPHVTLGRARDGARAAEFAPLEKLAKNVQYDA